ncbi:hypothetical protein C0993_001180 [Termitomyces sp. T159_Od127]|nr:hypothetical protein C0993_001180 [Termitomyces sp. T159_Od127]
MMMTPLPRSKSAPNGVPALMPTPLVRASSFHTIGEVIKGVKSERLVEHGEEEDQDAFNLSGFFPKEKQWGWMVVEADGGVKMGSLFGVSDQMIQEAIKGEDKLGVLSLGKSHLQHGEKLMIMWLGEMLKRLSGTRDDEDPEGLERNKCVDERPGYREDWTGHAARLDDAGGVDENFPIWGTDHGNSRDTKVPQVG